MASQSPSISVLMLLAAITWGCSNSGTSHTNDGGVSYSEESRFIFGVHNPGGERLMAAAGKRGWIMFSEKVTNPASGDGPDYSNWSRQGYGIIVRLNNGYDPDGTLPCSDRYSEFASAVAQWVRSSRGSNIWIIGNETNNHGEWPTCNGALEKITPIRYVQAFTLARAAIKALPGHSSDQVIPAAVSWLVDETSSNPNATGVDYFQTVLNLIGSGNFDGLALHVYTTNSGLVSDVTSEQLYQNTSIHLHFRAYRELLGVVPSSSRGLPAYITETNPLFTGWATAEPGWVPAVYKEIDNWNQVATNQVIRAVTLYRWPSYDAIYGIANFPAVQADFSQALTHDYRWPVH